MPQHNPNVGHLIAHPEQKDAIHMAIAPVIAGEDILPGTHIGLLADGRASTRCVGNTIGVADPFLFNVIRAGQRFWLFLYPGSISSLRHEWSHPSFPAGSGVGSTVALAALDMAASVAWLNAYATRVSPYDEGEGEAYSRFMASVEDGTIFYHGSDLHSYGELEEPEELFRHLSVVLGRPVNHEGFSYSCSC